MEDGLQIKHPMVQNGKLRSSMSSEAAQVLKGLENSCKEISLTSCLYDQKGSDLYEKITQLEEYYPFLAEEQMLERCSEQVAKHIPCGSVVVELGCGTGRKTAILLRAIVARHARCKFVGIDVSRLFLEEAVKNLLNLVPGLREQDLDMVQAEYLEGLKEARRRYPTQRLILVWLGSSVGNQTRDDAISFLREVVRSVGLHHHFFLCADMWKDVARLYSAYHDSKGVTELFIKNGMANALRMLGLSVTEEEEASWLYEVEVNKQSRRVEMYVRFPRGLELADHFSSSNIGFGERVRVEFSRKFTVDDLHDLASGAGYTIAAAWRDEVYGSQMLMPAVEAFRECWEDTEEMFRGLQDWRGKPIDLRHPFCFYYGHVHAFTKLKILPDMAESPLDVMFSRGIDPHVGDPSRCHSHPDIPPEWPESVEIMKYGRQIREKVRQALAGGMISLRMINFALEHERMHQETLQYMVAQERKKTFEKNFHTNTSGKVDKPHNTNGCRTSSNPTTLSIPPGEVTLGIKSSSGAFFWDNEYPQYRTSVGGAFAVSTKPVSISEFRDFIRQAGYEQRELWRADEYAMFHGNGITCPATWSCLDGDFWVHSPAATQHWAEIADDPVFLSLAEATAFCKWVGARIMTEAEYQRILDVVDAGTVHNGKVLGLGNGHMNGTVAKDVRVKRGSSRIEMMRDSGWEWTSTPFEPFPGFQPMPEYPEYSSDFFDGEHYVLKGSSPATHPSLVRDSFRNFYQRLYPYVFAKFRCCYDF